MTGPAFKRGQVVRICARRMHYDAAFRYGAKMRRNWYGERAVVLGVSTLGHSVDIAPLKCTAGMRQTVSVRDIQPIKAKR